MYTPPHRHGHVLPICPKCQKLISERHYERHLSRCGIIHRQGPQSLYVPSATAQVESPERGITYGPPEKESGRTDWRKLAVAGFVIFLLIGTLVVFFILYGLSLL
jgi:hypothetical protein